MEKRCRMCGCSYAVLISAVKDTKLLKQINKLFNIAILQEDKLPRVICSPCNEIVNNNWEFYVYVQKVQKMLLKEVAKQEQYIKKVTTCNDKRKARNYRLSSLKVQSEELPILTNERDDIEVSLTKPQHERLPILNEEQAVINTQVPFIELQNTELPILPNEEEVDNIHVSCIDVQNNKFPILTNEEDVNAFPIISDEQEDETETIFIEVITDADKSDTLLYNSQPELEVQESLPDKNDECLNRIPTLNLTIQNQNNPPLKGPLEYEWKCANCLTLNTFSTMDKLHEHYQQVHQQPSQFACTDCEFISDKLNTFIEHVKTHRPSFKFCCNVCGQWFMTFGDLIEHRLKHNNGWTSYTENFGKLRKTRENTNGSIRLRKYKHCCMKCNKKFKTARGPAAHIRYGCCSASLTSITTTKCFL